MNFISEYLTTYFFSTVSNLDFICIKIQTNKVRVLDSSLLKTKLCFRIVLTKIRS